MGCKGGIDKERRGRERNGGKRVEGSGGGGGGGDVKEGEKCVRMRHGYGGVRAPVCKNEEH